MFFSLSLSSFPLFPLSPLSKLYLGEHPLFTQPTYRTLWVGGEAGEGLRVRGNSQAQPCCSLVSNLGLFSSVTVTGGALHIIVRNKSILGYTGRSQSQFCTVVPRQIQARIPIACSKYSVWQNSGLVRAQRTHSWIKMQERLNRSTGVFLPLMETKVLDWGSATMRVYVYFASADCNGWLCILSN
jgi:hypothetical protein